MTEENFVFRFICFLFIYPSVIFFFLGRTKTNTVHAVCGAVYLQ